MLTSAHRPPGTPLAAAHPLACDLQVEWLNPGDPTKGFRYLYLSPEDYASLTARAPPGTTLLKANRVVAEGGEERYRLTGGWGVAGWLLGWLPIRPASA
jgi:acetyl-CoA carboxylase/biotin carboxylase 1